ncbi:nicotinate phosphoribosyltransferase [Bacillus ectoiniformans]|uniref:nicotinate phosphoribosyltransferase n=1 Tax=Bacillus ectoiniformans TaxID=1494429 RepID=UPI00195AE296|nr:nicotinate phosphoribosyltransferase [Bacillus ectoiniformans]MBM7650416.1 nicotinate phosphoribosyltransferase [Bacillus ectoiniformans]
MYLYEDDSLSLHTDLYQVNMAYVYWKDGVHEKNSVFDLYFRKLPFENGFAVFAGLEKAADYIKNLRFTENDIEYLRSVGEYDEDFLEYLKNLTFSGQVRAMREGEIVFANEPLVRVKAPLIQAQLLETALLNIINFQTLIATKASRVKQVCGEDTVMEFGTRRAQEMDAAVWGARATYIAGFDATSNVRAGKLFGMPISGTHAHSMVQAYRDEYTAFRKYAEAHKKCVFLVDTYDTLKSGVPTAIRVAKEMEGQIEFAGIRLDSGDLAYLSKEARKMLDEAGFPDTKIIASNDLDEYTIMNLKSQGAKIDSWGIGTKVITAYDQPALGAVYKLVSIEDEAGNMADTIKISGNPEKVTTPGMKKVYRIINKGNGNSEGDYIVLEGEQPEQEEKIKMFHPIHTYISKFVTNFEARDLHADIFEEGKLVYTLPSLPEIQSHVASSLELLWDEYKRMLNPEAYPVDLSEACWNNKMEHIQQVKVRTEQMIQNKGGE